MTMLQLAGPPAATAFRLAKLRTELRALTPAITNATIRFEHFVHLERPLERSERRVLEALLAYGGAQLGAELVEPERSRCRRAGQLQHRHELEDSRDVGQRILPNRRKIGRRPPRVVSRPRTSP